MMGMNHDASNVLVNSEISIKLLIRKKGGRERERETEREGKEEFKIAYVIFSCLNV